MNKTFGWIVLIVICLIPVFLWFTLGDGSSELSGYGDITHSLGELFALVGMTMFAMTFVLSTKIRFIEDIFGGLDKVYIVHGILGGTALMLILFHPILLVLKFVPAQMALAAQYLLPSSYWGVNFGMIAMAGFIILIGITLFTKMKYHRWKFTHEFLGLVFALAVAHIFLVRGVISGDNIFAGYYVYATAVSAIGLIAFSYSLFLKNRLIKNAVYIIQNINQRKEVFEIEMVPEHKPLQYKSGQFVFLRFYNKNLSKEPHPFSIASKSDAEVLRIIVKKLGDFTEKLGNLKNGDKVSVEGPYGRFNFKKSSKDQVWLAGGIGITPFLGMVEDFEHSKIDTNVDLYYSVKTPDEFIGYETLASIASKNKHFRFIPWDTSKNGWITAENVEGLSGDVKDKDFFICGPDNFKESLIKGLAKQGVKKSNISEEAFDFR